MPGAQPGDSAVNFRGGSQLVTVAADSIPGPKLLLTPTGLPSCSTISVGTNPTFDSYVEAAVRRFQARHGVIETGVVNQQTLNALNVPAETRLRQLGADEQGHDPRHDEEEERRDDVEDPDLLVVGRGEPVHDLRPEGRLRCGQLGGALDSGKSMRS